MQVIWGMGERSPFSCSPEASQNVGGFLGWVGVLGFVVCFFSWTGSPAGRNPRLPATGGFLKGVRFAAAAQPLTGVSAGFGEPLA